LFKLQELVAITDGQLIATTINEQIQQLVTDSRSTILPNSLFVALKGERFNGHDFIPELVNNQNISFLVDDENAIRPGYSFLLVNDTKIALQKIAQYQREKYQIPVIGITGSNGKTIVKEWLFQLLSPDFYIVKSPKSYNSQVGVPLSVLQMHEKHELGVFEAGISKYGEMQYLSAIIQPTIGIFTNIGNAHDAGFTSKSQKLNEKLKLFQSCELIVLEANKEVEQAIKSLYPNKKVLSWAISDYQNLLPNSTTDPFFNKNIGHCITVMKRLGISDQEIESRIQQLETLPMRLELVNGKWNTVILNDSYSNDLSGLEVLLDHANKTAPQKELVLCLDQFQESGLSNDILCEKIKNLILGKKIDFLLLFGEFYNKNKDFFKKIVKNSFFFENSKSGLKDYDWSKLSGKLIVCKGGLGGQSILLN